MTRAAATPPTSPSPLPRCPVCGWEWREGLPPALDGVPLFCPRGSCGVELERTPDGALRPRTFRLAGHDSLCVLPFAFGDEPEAVLARLRGSDRWSCRTFAPDNPADVERTEYFLPYVRRFLYPTLYAPKAEGPDGSAAAPRPPATCHHFRFDLSKLGETTRSGGLPLELHAFDARKDQTFRFPLRLDSAELLVFGYRVGFLVLRFVGTGPNVSYFEQMTALTFLRTIAPLYPGYAMPDLGPPDRPRYSVPQLVAYLLAEFAPAGAEAPPAPWRVAADARLPVKPVYDDRMMIYAFSCIDRDTVLEDGEQNLDLLRRGTPVAFDEDPPGAEPPPEQEEDEVASWLRLRRQGFTKDGTVLVVFNTDRFHERFLGLYHGTYYLDIFLLAALQRVTLLSLFERLSDISGLTRNDARSRRQLRRVRKDLLLFKNQCWFSQITNRERGLELWKTWQRVFETHTLLQEVNEQSSELETYLRTQYRERMELLVRTGGFLATAVPAVFGLEAVVGHFWWFRPLRLALLVLLFLGAGLFAGFVLLRREDGT